VDDLFDKRMDIEELLNKEIGELAYVEVIDYNRANEQRERTNDEHQKTRQQERERVPSRKHSSLER
jgi:hypothetical protein